MITKEELLPLLQDPDVSRIIHDYADVDIGVNSLHHTVGPGATQVQAGNDTIDYSDFTQYPFTPNAPTGINVTSNIITTNDGNKLAEVIVTWTPVSTNTDGTSVTSDELGSYLVSWRIAGPNDWTPEFSVDPATNVAYFFGLKPGTVIDVRVAAVNLAQNQSDYGYAFSVTVGTDLTPPNQPSVPIVTSLFGAIRVQWDGKDSLGAVMALDFDHVDVHVGNVSTFVPDDTNKVDSIPTINGGAVVLSYTDYGTPHYIKFTALDKSNNRSIASAASASVAARQGVNADFQDISATKILTGKLSVDVGLGGRILIGPLNPDGTLVSPLGARMELRNDGVHIYNSSNVEVATMAIISGLPQITISGPIISGGQITGTSFTTSGSTQRILIDNSDNISFYDISGLVGKVNSPSGAGVVQTISANGQDWVQVGNTGVSIASLDGYVTVVTKNNIDLSPGNGGVGNVRIVQGQLLDPFNVPYPRWAGTTQRTIAGNRNTATTDASGRVSFAHGLTSTPTHFVGTPNSGAFILRSFSKDATNVTFEVHNDAGAIVTGTSVTIDWFALG